MLTRLIVNADDYCRTHRVSEGIRAAHSCGIVTSTSAMMNMSGADIDLRAAIEECPRLGLGVHLVLTSGSPIISAVRMPSLVRVGGRFPRVQELVPRLSSVNIDEVRNEWIAQVARFVDVAQRYPDHIDSHYHVSYLDSRLFRVMLELARDCRCAIRLPIQTDVSHMVGGIPNELIQQNLQWSPVLLSEFRPRFPDRLIDTFFGPAATASGLLALLSSIPPGSTELMCHPGYCDQELIANSSYHQMREVELAVLTDPRIRTLIEARGIQLIRFDELQDRVREEQESQGP